VVADIPGLIEGAAAGRGLGIRFLRHIERTRLLVYVIDASDDAKSPLEALSVVEEELRAFNPGLLQRVRVIAANKIDLPHGTHLPSLSALCAERAIPLFPLSAVTGEGVEPLVRYLAAQLKTVHSSQFTVHGPEVSNPASGKPRPSTVNRQRSTVNPNPSTVDCEPSTPS